jgi:branched-chain amino acid transport system substrate-binding protein
VTPKLRPSFAAPLLATLALLLPGTSPRAAEFDIPVLVPLTGFLALEGQSQRDGALLAIAQAPAGLRIHHEVSDTGVSPEAAVLALENALDGKPIAVVASMLGTQLLAMLPVAAEAKLPVLTISGTAKVTQLGNPWVFRFFPGDNVVKLGHARYVVEVLGKVKPAIIYQSDAYGQSGAQFLGKAFAQLGVAPVLSEAVDVAVKDMLPVLSRAQAAGADVLVAHLHAPATALLVRQNAAGGGLPLVAGSALATPSTAALLEPGELKGACAESASAPILPQSPAGERFLAQYRETYHSDPDTYAVAQYDGTMMALTAIAAGATSPAALREALAQKTYQGVAMTYRSDGTGNMAHSAIIVCYDGSSRTPRLVQRYDDIAALP